MKPKITCNSIDDHIKLNAVIQDVIMRLNKGALERSLNLEVAVLDSPEMERLNIVSRAKAGPTNILTFIIGDEVELSAQIFLCLAVIDAESAQLEVAFNEHFTHTFLHGILHAYGYDHQNQAQTQVMHAQENMWMEQLGLQPPWPKE
jgi:probable rRNA maturation factor